MSRFTVLGAGGTIGRALVAHLQALGHEVDAIDREGLPRWVSAGSPAGHVICCVGLTGDFRTRRLETADAHVAITAHVLADVPFESFLYLSSTRVYMRATTTSEDAVIGCDPNDPSDLYNISKLAGEALCLSDPRETVRVARLSNVHAPDPGSDTFLGQILREGRRSGIVRIHQGSGSTKDYIAMTDVVALLPRIALHGRRRIYNVAAGCNVTHQDIATVLTERFGWRIEFAADAPDIVFPAIDISRIRAEFTPPLSDLLRALWTMGRELEVPCSRSMRLLVG